jgi:hypothetical protein
MDMLWVFAAVAPLALVSLFAYASHIDPLSGRWRSRGTSRNAARHSALEAKRGQ